MWYKTIFIDWDGTLSSSRFWDRWKRDDSGYERYSRIQEVLFDSAEGKLMIADWMRGLRSASNILLYLHEMTGIPTIELDSELRYSCENMSLIDPGVIPKIQALRNHGTKVVLATDNMDVFRLWTVGSLKLDELFDGILTSDTAGALKTEIDQYGSSPFFRQYLAQHNLRAGDSVIIDDSEDTSILNKIGIDFLHVDQATDLGAHLDSLLRG